MLEWTVQNVVLIEGEMGDFKLTKVKAKEVIDPAVALSIAFCRAVASPKKKVSVYQRRGVLEI